MDTKLTLSLDESVIEAAKIYARKQKTSISRIVEHFLLSLTTDDCNEDISPLVKSLSGVLKETPADGNSYIDYLDEKYR